MWCIWWGKGISVFFVDVGTGEVRSTGTIRGTGVGVVGIVGSICWMRKAYMSARLLQEG